LPSHFESIEQVISELARGRYVADRALATVLFLAHKLEKPIFLEVVICDLGSSLRLTFVDRFHDLLQPFLKQVVILSVLFYPFDSATDRTVLGHS